MKKRVWTLLLTMAICLTVFVGCSVGNGAPDMGFFAPSMSDDNSYVYEEIKELGFVDVATQPDVYLSLDRHTSGYTLMRRVINEGNLVNPESVRIEDFVNYFNYDVSRDPSKSLTLGGSVIDCPWNDQHKLMRVTVAAEQVSVDSKKANNVVFLIDTSGSMYGEDRLPLVQQAFTAMLPMLGAQDSVSIVTYASGVKTLCKGEQCVESNKAKVAAILEDLQASGSTNGQGGIETAYRIAEQYFVQGGNNRIILATDGDFNIGASSNTALKQLIKDKSKKGIDLSIIGVGMGNTRDDFMQTLAKNGNGNAYYVDSINEARRVLVEEFGGTMNTVAYDAKAAVNFNAEVVDSYRIIGYENSLMSKDEFEDDNKDAGEIGSGHVVTAVYEISLKQGVTEGRVADVNVKYRKAPVTETETPQVLDETCQVTVSSHYVATDDDKFVACVVEFGLLLRDSQYKGTANFDSLQLRLGQLGQYVSAETDSFKGEFVTLVEQAATLWNNQKLVKNK